MNIYTSCLIVGVLFFIAGFLFSSLTRIEDQLHSMTARLNVLIDRMDEFKTRSEIIYEVLENILEETRTKK